MKAYFGGNKNGLYIIYSLYTQQFSSRHKSNNHKLHVQHPIVIHSVLFSFTELLYYEAIISAHICNHYRKNKILHEAFKNAGDKQTPSKFLILKEI